MKPIHIISLGAGVQSSTKATQDAIANWIGCLDDPHSFVYKKDPKNSFAVEFVEVIK